MGELHHHALGGFLDTPVRDGAAHHPDGLELVLGHEHVLAAGAGFIDVECRENALLLQFSIQVKLHVAGALEFFENDVVHAAAGLDERRRQNGDGPAFFDVAGRPEELLRLVQRRRIQTAGQRAAAGGLHQVVRPGQTRNGIHQNNNVLAVLHQPLRARQHHLRHLHVVGRLLVEGGIDHLALDLPLHVGHFLGPLVDEQHDEFRIHMLGFDGLRDLL